MISMQLSESWGKKNQNSVWWNDEREAVVRRNEAGLKGLLVASDKETKEICIEGYREGRG